MTTSGIPGQPETDPTSERIAAFIARWQGSGAAERANYQLFLSELCDVLGVERPEPAVPDDAANAYVFERAVVFHHADGTTSTGRIDLYKRGAFVLEAKQGSDAGADGASPARRGHGVRGSAAWDDAMVRARGQAEQYLRALPADEPTPPFLVVVDVGHSVELFADFTRSGRAFLPFPDARSHRLPLASLADTEVRERLRLLWTDPDALDPARRSARVTRDIAARLAALARELEAAGHTADDVAHFLMRCLFTMFAEDVGLLPERSFTGLLERLRPTPHLVAPMLQSLWETMRTGGFSPALLDAVPRFNGSLFESTVALPLTAAQVDRLLEAARADWRDVEPAIFGTLLERALDPGERHALGAHFTPRAYVERLVLPTVVEPLRDEWQAAFTAAATLARQGRIEAAQREVLTFLDRLCHVRVLDPACGSGNFLYVTLEHLKRLEGEVVDALEGFGHSQGLLDLAGQTVDPHQLLGLEVNPRAAAIAELVLWIGYLQWHLRNRSTPPPEPILKAFHTIECRDAVLEYDFPPLPRRDEHGQPITRWDGKTTKRHPITGEDVPDETAQVQLWDYPNARQAHWPETDFVVGNPPFIGTRRMRLVLGDGYVEALMAQHPGVADTADYVMYWWSHAAEAARLDRIRRFGFITTNSITQSFNRAVVESHLSASPPLSLVWAIPDHPWVQSSDGAAVRVAMTVGRGGVHDGVVVRVLSERDGCDRVERVVHLSTSLPAIIGPDLRAGASTSGSHRLEANRGVAFWGVKFYGEGFIVDVDTADDLSQRQSGTTLARPFLSGRDLTGRTRGLLTLDCDGLDENQLASTYPATYQWLLERVKPVRAHNPRPFKRERWWIFGENQPGMRRATMGLHRYIATAETAKHRFFIFVPGPTLAEGTVNVIASDDSRVLGALSSRTHTTWAFAAGGTLEDRPRYNKNTCFEPFPFPFQASEDSQDVAWLAEQLDAHRKRQQAVHPGLTLTGMYNVLEKLRTGEALTAKEREIHEQGLVSVLAEIHDRLDEAVLAAYGWSDLAPALVGKPGGTTPNRDVSPEQAEAEEELLSRLVALNAERAEKERRGLVRWLRPDYQAPGAAAQPEQHDLELDDAAPAAAAPLAAKRPWPDTLAEQARAVREALAAAGRPVTPADLARTFAHARTPTVADLLATLATLGHARPVGDGCFVIPQASAR